MKVLIVAATHREVASLAGGVAHSDGVEVFYEVISGPEDHHRIQGHEFDIAIGLEKLSFESRVFVKSRVRPTAQFLAGLQRLADESSSSSRGEGAAPPGCSPAA